MDARVPVPAGSPENLPPHYQRNARLALVLLLLGLGVWTVRNFLPALIWAVIVAIAVWPLFVKARERAVRDRHNILAPALFTVGIAVVFGLPFILLGIQAAREAHDVIAFAERITTSGIPVPDWLGHLPFGSEQVKGWWQENLAQPVPTAAILKRLDRGSLLVLGRQFGLNVAHRVILFFFMLMTLFFVLREGEGLVGDLLVASHKLFGARGERIARQMVSSIHGTVDGLVLVGLGEGVLLGIAYAVAGVPHPTLLGAVTAVAAMIPFMVIVVLAGVGLVLLAAGSVGAAVAVVGFGTVVVFLADHLVRPVLIGGTTRLPFLWVLFGILGGVESFGLAGLFIGPALMAALILLWRDLVNGENAEASRAAAH
ncbi:MAG: AI-2E family transporter [Parafilimonas terrae]|nr:AI-2E family transporter [Parafilimonas terrae]